MKFSNENRDQLINQLQINHHDLLIIGGGITGAGIALDAATRGMKAALVEMQDFAAGTSSRSTKLIHGGLRYLKQFEVKMVAEVGKERAIVYENGPHVTTPEWMLLPLHEGGTFGKLSTSMGLQLYDFLAGVNKDERRKMLTAKETMQKEPLLKKTGLKGGGYYVEYRTDDARLTIEVMKKAVENGVLAINYAKANELLYENGRLIGVKIEDQLTGEMFSIKAEKIINATGPWVDSIRNMDGSNNGKSLKLTKGVHLVIDGSRFPLKQAVYFDTPDKRMIFAIPRDGKTYVGTTDTFYELDPVSPRMTLEDRDYLISAIHYMFPEVRITKDDVESSWAGVRPLIWEEGKDPSEISRKDEIWQSKSGLITIAGGKLTGYRKMAETIVDLVASKFEEEKNINFKSCQTLHLPISGGDVGGSIKLQSYIAEQTKIGQQIGLTADEANFLTSLYGSNVPYVYHLIEMNTAAIEKCGLPKTLFAELHYALEAEMIATPIDFFFRRTGALLFNIALVKTYKEKVINYMADYFQWDEETKGKRTSELDGEIVAIQHL